MRASEETTAPGQLYCPTCERTFATGPLCPDDATRLVTLEAAITADPRARARLVLPIAPPPPTSPTVRAAFIATPVVEAPPAPSPPLPVLPPAPSSRRLLLGVAGLAAIAVALGVLFLIRSLTGDDPRPQPTRAISPPDASRDAPAADATPR